MRIRKRGREGGQKGRLTTGVKNQSRRTEHGLLAIRTPDEINTCSLIRVSSTDSLVPNNSLLRTRPSRKVRSLITQNRREQSCAIAILFWPERSRILPKVKVGKHSQLERAVFVEGYTRFRCVCLEDSLRLAYKRYVLEPLSRIVHSWKRAN
jgi:hypothetical protein